MRVIRIAVLAAFLLAACGQAGGGDATTTSAARETTATAAATAAGEDEGPAIGIEDIPQECIDTFVAYLRAIEPAVQGFNFNEATQADMEALTTEVEGATAEYEAASTAAGCDELNLDVSDEEAFDLMIDLAQREAPGTAAYFESIRDFSASFGEGTGSAASGDCETDIDALQVIVDQGGTMSDLTMAEIGTVAGLITSISTVCSGERSQEFFAKADVAAFLESGG